MKSINMKRLCLVSVFLIFMIYEYVLSRNDKNKNIIEAFLISLGYIYDLLLFYY